MQIPTTKQETLPKGVGVAKFDFTKTFRNQLFCTYQGITSSILDYKSQRKYFKVQNHEHFITAALRGHVKKIIYLVPTT